MCVEKDLPYIKNSMSLNPYAVLSVHSHKDALLQDRKLFPVLLSMGHTIHLLAFQDGVLFNKLCLTKVRGRVQIKRPLLWLSFSILGLP